MNSTHFNDFYNQYISNFEASTELLNTEEITFEELNNPTESDLANLRIHFNNYDIDFQKQQSIKENLKQYLQNNFSFKDFDFENALQLVTIDVYQNNYNDFNSSLRNCCNAPRSIDLMRCYNDCDANAKEHLAGDDGHLADLARNSYKLGCYKGCNNANDQLN